MGDQNKIFIESEEENFEEKEVKKTLRVLAFVLGDETYCVDVRQAREVIRMPEITRVPNAPAFVIGAANLRGRIISILDTHYFFGLAQKGKPREARVIVTEGAGESVGLMVDRVKDTLEIEEESVQAPLATLRGKLAEYTLGQVPLGKDILILLDLARILQSDDIRRLRKGDGK